MSRAATTLAKLREAVKFFEQNDFNQVRAAKAAGISRTTMQSRLREAVTRGLMNSISPDGERHNPNRPKFDSNLDIEIEHPNLPSSELDPDELIDQAAARFNRHRDARDARRWMEIKVKSNKPIGLTFVGDPHIDNNGCNWPLLKRDIAILKGTAGLHAVNIGDLTDNWIGRLIRLYADQEMSKKQAWKLAKYFMRDAGISWLCHIIGNHDAWGDGPYLLKANAAPEVPVEDWQSRFVLVFPNGVRIRVHVAHDFPGSSIWNPMHGPQKASMLFEEADIYACGHKHQWAIVQGENANRGFIYHLIRTRGYKFIDHHADQLGYASQKFGASITAIIDPTVDGPQRVSCFPDLEEAAKFLMWKRSR